MTAVDIGLLIVGFIGVVFIILGMTIGREEAEWAGVGIFLSYLIMAILVVAS
jgi:hypothetical protein